ncbi:hypothetical protein [Chromobacterium haemolyticum]|uniref:hypothetical protein n=1 Tax=Chromobacterium haemolyticum TaxID=394935 RepID=UPI0002ED1854|nr:hypothetical protein [Chromobacterium haemolyticum]
MERHQLTFTLTYSTLMEEMHQTLMGRVDRLCTFLQLFLGCAVITTNVPTIYTGGLMAFLAAVQLVYQPAAKSMEAKIQKERYLDIKRQSGRMTDEQLSDALNSAAPHDSTIPGSLTHPAWLASSLQLGLQIPRERLKMSWKERLYSSAAGNCPNLAPIIQPAERDAR